jgi:hypothetical protein
MKSLTLIAAALTALVFGLAWAVVVPGATAGGRRFRRRRKAAAAAIEEPITSEPFTPKPTTQERAGWLASITLAQ